MTRKDLEKSGLSSSSVQKAQEWLDENQSKMPSEVARVFVLLLQMVSILDTNWMRLKLLRTLLAESWGFKSKSEKSSSAKKDTSENKKTNKGGLRKKSKKKRSSTRKKSSSDKQHPVFTLNIEYKDWSKILVNCNYNFGREDGGFVRTFTSHEYIDLQVTQTVCRAEVETVVDQRTGKQVTATPPEVPAGFKYTYQTIVNFVIFHVGHQIPMTRLATMFSGGTQTFTKSLIYRFHMFVAQAFLPVFLAMSKELFKKARHIQCDDTNVKVPKAKVDSFISSIDETGNDKARANQAHEIVKTVHRELGLIGTYQNKKEPTPKKKMNLTVITGLLNEDNPQSRITIKLTHFGGAGDLVGRLLKFRDHKKEKELYITSDLASSNNPQGPTVKKFKIHQVGCSSHARRAFWRYRELDDESYGVLRGFSALAELEDHLDGASPEKITAWRRRFGRRIWTFITSSCQRIQKTWPKETVLYEAAEYILSNEYFLTRYLKQWFLEPNNNRSERYLRPEKLMLSCSKFRDSFNGRIVYDVISSVMTSCTTNNIPFTPYAIDLLKNRDRVAIAPELWTPIAWWGRQQVKK